MEKISKGHVLLSFSSKALDRLVHYIDILLNPVIFIKQNKQKKTLEFKLIQIHIFIDYVIFELI